MTLDFDEIHVVNCSCDGIGSTDPACWSLRVRIAETFALPAAPSGEGGAPTFRPFDPTPTVDNIVRYVEGMAENHPHAADVFRHVAHNLRAVFGHRERSEPRAERAHPSDEGSAARRDEAQP